jgi:hypothetical protein
MHITPQNINALQTLKVKGTAKGLNLDSAFLYFSDEGVSFIKCFAEISAIAVRPL